MDITLAIPVVYFIIPFKSANADCGNPPRIDSAMINEGATTFPSKRTYQCNDGYVSNGMSSTIKCLEDGVWESTLFNCTATTIGEYCFDKPCFGTGVECSIPGHICSCGSLYRYNASKIDCEKVCSALEHDTIEIEDVTYVRKQIRMPYYAKWIQTDTVSECFGICADDESCITVVVDRTSAYTYCYTLDANYELLKYDFPTNIEFKTRGDFIVGSKKCIEL